MTDKNQAFDQRIKDLLEQAQAPVPEGLWGAIQSRVPAKPVRKAAPWWWAGAGLVAAAATALTLVLGGTFRSAPVSVVPGQEAVAQQETPSQDVPAAEAEEITVAEASPAVLPVHAIRKAVADIPSGETPSEAAETVPDGTAGIETASTKDSAPAPETASKPEKASKQPAAGKPERWVDPFARMAYEDLHRKHTPRTSIQINGLVGTNDKAMATLRSGMMAAPAKIQSESGRTTYITEEGESVYGIPVSFGVGAKFYLSERWALGTGLNYSLLSRSFPGSYTKDGSLIKTSNSNIKHSVQYIGIPVNIYFDLFSTRAVKMYTFAGGSLEKGISQKYTIPGAEGVEVWKQKVPGLQGSAALGLGFQLKFSDHLGLYLDPSARYYFGADQPKSIRTQQNVMFNLELGLRFDL